MRRQATLGGRTVFYEYDEYQDALFITYAEQVGLTYYEELEGGVLRRRDAETDQPVGYTVRNVSLKVCRQFVPEAATA